VFRFYGETPLNRLQTPVFGIVIGKRAMTMLASK
jgi:hypothetical protein